MARKNGETKPERIARVVAQAVHAGKEWHLPGVDFNDPNRPKTCLEVDFPILPINRVSSIEASSGAAKKPIYQMSKWWARRQSSVFRAMLIAAATKAPDDPAEAAKLVWDAYYGNHQKNEAFGKLKVADIFMGGGTTVVEGARLGMQMYGNDLNPVAWLIVENQLAEVDATDVQRLLHQIEAEVKPQVMQFYACDCPRGHKGKWTHKPTQRVMGPTFDPLSLTPEQRPEYGYEGPEVIYTFWAKHGICQNAECGHRTPIMSSPVIASKTVSVQVWRSKTCAECGQTFDVEAKDARLAPEASFVCSPEEPLYTVRNDDGNFNCPCCGHINKQAIGNTDRKDKKVELHILVHPDWLKGIQGKSTDGSLFGGSVTDGGTSTARWYSERAKNLKLIEVRGPLPDSMVCPDTMQEMFTDHRGANVPRKSTLACAEPTCGRQTDVLTLIHKSGVSAPIAPYAIMGYCPTCDSHRLPSNGRFFSCKSIEKQAIAGCREWDSLSTSELKNYYPQSVIPEGLETSIRTPLHKYQYKKWADFFNPRQLLVHARLLKAILSKTSAPHQQAMRRLLLGCLQLYLRYNCMFTIWHFANNQISAFLSNNNLQPKSTAIETAVFSAVGEGTWASASEGICEGLAWQGNPWELVATEELSSLPIFSELSGKSQKVYPRDSANQSKAILECGSSTRLSSIKDGEYDMVVTDPPFGDIVQYAELAGFFYSWLRLGMGSESSGLFSSENLPTALEAVENAHRHAEDSEPFYSRVLTSCWSEAYRILKPGGILAFTFHHDKDGPWVAVLESLFKAGYYLEATFPVRSDETKGEGSKPGTFGAQKVEYDIIHVCRKRTGDAPEISWARLRRQIMQDVRQLQDILTKHQTAGLQEADLQVIRRGKALEYYSKHYGKVYVEKGREFTVLEALLAINQLLDDQADTTAEAPPVLAEAYTRQFFRLFADKTSIPRDQMQKYLRGTGVSPQEFIDRGWCSEKAKVFTPVGPLDWAQSLRGIRRDAIGRDFDQVMFMVGACFEGSGIKLSDTLDNPNFKPHPATESVLDWLTRHGGTPTIKTAARTALQLYRSWVAKNQKKVQVERTLFDLIDEEA